MPPFCLTELAAVCTPSAACPALSPHGHAPVWLTVAPGRQSRLPGALHACPMGPGKAFHVKKGFVCMKGWSVPIMGGERAWHVLIGPRGGQGRQGDREL